MNLKDEKVFRIYYKHMNLEDEKGTDLVGTPNLISFYPTLYNLFCNSNSDIKISNLMVLSLFIMKI